MLIYCVETNKVTQVQRSETTMASLKPPPIEKLTPERVFGKNGSFKKQKVNFVLVHINKIIFSMSILNVYEGKLKFVGKLFQVPMTATSYTVAALQVVTNSFSQDSLLGEGSLGRVYKAEFPNGKVKNLCIRNII